MSRDNQSPIRPSTPFGSSDGGLENAAAARDPVRAPDPDAGAPQKAHAGDHKLDIAPH
jgi:hypothetical protein